MSSGSACWILWLTPMDWLALSIGRSGSQPLEYSPNYEGKCIASSRGVDTREFAAGEGYSELFGNCKVYIFWNQCSYIAIKTKDLYILLNKKGDEQTYEFYSQLMEDLE